MYRPSCTFTPGGVGFPHVAARNAGITTFDAADHYGPAELLIGKFLREHPEQRDAVQVLTKLCVFGSTEMLTIGKDSVRQAVDASRRRLGVDRVDLMQFYWQEYGIRRYVDGALYLTELQQEGLLRHVGVTNFDVPRLREMVDAGASIVSNQVQYSLLDRRPENFMTSYCAEHNIKLLPYGVLAGGLLSDRYLGVPASAVKFDTYSKGKYGRVIQQAGGWPWFQELLKVLDGIATKHNTSISNVAAKWVLDKPQVPAIIIGARNAAHVQEQVALFSFDLDASDRDAIEGILEASRRPSSDCYSWERGMEW